MNDDRVWILLSTFANEADARRTARALVDEGLVACAQIETCPITSIYRWEGAVHEEPEVLLRAKTCDAVRRRAMERLSGLHPYDTPQIVAWEAAASADYAAWTRAQCRPLP